MTIISFKKLAVTAGATLMLVAPMAAMATFEEKADLLGQLGQAMKENPEKSTPTLQNAVRIAKNNLAGAQAAAQKGDFKRAIALLTAMRNSFSGKWTYTLGEPFEGIILNLLKALNQNIDELKKQPQQPKASLKKSNGAAPPIPAELKNALQEKIIQPEFSVKFSAKPGKDKKYTAQFSLSNLLKKNVPTVIALKGPNGKVVYRLTMPVSRCRTAPKKAEGLSERMSDVVVTCVVSTKVALPVRIAFGGSGTVVLSTAKGQVVAQLPWENGKQKAPASSEPAPSASAGQPTSENRCDGNNVSYCVGTWRHDCSTNQSVNCADMAGKSGCQEIIDRDTNPQHPRTIGQCI